MVDKIKKFLFKNQNIRQTVAKNTFWLTASVVISRLIRAALVIYIARILGTAGFGILSYALSLAGLFSIFAEFGFTGFLTRVLVQEKEKADAYLSTIFILRLITTIISALIIFIGSPLLITIGGVRPLLPIVIFLILFDSLRGHSTAIARSQNRMELETLFGITTEIFLTGLGFLVAMTIPSTITLAITYALGSGFGFLASVLLLREQFKKSFKNFKLSLVKPILRAAWPFALMGMFGSFLVNIDVLIIGLMRTPNELGLYAADNKLIQLLYVLPSLLAISTFPIISRLINLNDQIKIKNLIEKTMALSLAAALPLMVGGIILASQIINLLFGATYLDAAPALQLLLLTLPMVFIGIMASNSIFAYNRQSVFIISAIGGLIGNIVLDIILIRPYGIVGSAIATLIVNAFANSVNYYQLKKIIRFKILSYLPKIILATLVLGVLTIFMKTLGVPLLINIAVSGAFYFFLLYIFKEKTILEIKLLFK